MKPDLCSAAVCAVALLLATRAIAQPRQDYPTRPIRIIVAQAPASGPDLMARTIGQKLTGSRGQQVVVENRAGANGIIGMEAAAKSKPDGYTLVLAVLSALTMNPYVYKQLPCDTLSRLRTDHPDRYQHVRPGGQSLAAGESVKEVVALGRARPGALNCGSFGVGNQTHLAGELFAIATAIKMTHVPYKDRRPPSRT